jgi:RNA polymerase sigma-70 factor (ECF subfamily)
LPEELKTILILRDMQGLAYEEIAAALGCNLGTVKSRLFRARLAAKEKLSREGLLCAVKK